MQALTGKEYKTFQTIARMSQKTLHRSMAKFLQSKYENVVVKPEYIYAIGDIPVALVAHMDTVFKSPPENFYYDTEKTVMWSPDGLGADDRAGVFAIIKILQSGLKPTVIFTTDEESGGLGATKLVKDISKPYTPLKYVIQLDRRGSIDCVFYDCDNKEFTEYVENFGFIESFGSFSDISVICPTWGIAGVNLSIGYENEHSYVETLNTSYMLETIKKVKMMLREVNIPEFKYIKNRYSLTSKYLYPGYDDEKWWSDMCTCKICGKKFSSIECIPVLGATGETLHYYCPDCCVDKVLWCTECNEAFEITEGTDTDLPLCPICQIKESI